MLVVVALACGRSAQADPGTFLFLDSQPGDFIGGGIQQTFTPADSTFSESYDGSLLTVSVFPFAGGFWFVNLAAPPGQPLVPGTYTGAVRAAFRGPGQPGIDIFGDGRGCNTDTGTFTVNTAVYGPSNYVQTFDATFEQHCEGATPALLGEISISNPPPPPPLELGLTVALNDSVSKVTGTATITGTVGCSEPAAVALSVTLTQRTSRRTVARASTFTQINCTSPNPTAWSLSFSDPNGLPFLNGSAQVDAFASATDPNFGTNVTRETHLVVKLKYQP